jgi:hypothetical protein
MVTRPFKFPWPGPLESWLEAYRHRMTRIGTAVDVKLRTVGLDAVANIRLYGVLTQLPAVEILDTASQHGAASCAIYGPRSFR